MRLDNEKWEQSQLLTALNFEGKLIPGSGSGSEKLDIRAGGAWSGLLIENKWTGKKTLTLEKSWLKKARSQAINMGCLEHALLLDFEDAPLPLRYICIPEWLFIEWTKTKEQERRYLS